MLSSTALAWRLTFVLLMYWCLRLILYMEWGRSPTSFFCIWISSHFIILILISFLVTSWSLFLILHLIPVCECSPYVTKQFSDTHVSVLHRLSSLSDPEVLRAPVPRLSLLLFHAKKPEVIYHLVSGCRSEVPHNPLLEFYACWSSSEFRKNTAFTILLVSYKRIRTKKSSLSSSTRVGSLATAVTDLTLERSSRTEITNEAFFVFGKTGRTGFR